MPNVMAALPNIGGALCSTPQSLADARCWSQGVIKPLFCVLEDELLSASDELLRETGQPHHVVRSRNELNVAKVASCNASFLKLFFQNFPKLKFLLRFYKYSQY